MRDMTDETRDAEWSRLMGVLPELLGRPVEVTVTVAGGLVAAMRGIVLRGDAMAARDVEADRGEVTYSVGGREFVVMERDEVQPPRDVPLEEAVIVYVGSGHAAGFVVQRPLLTAWELVEHEDSTRLVLEMGSAARIEAEMLPGQVDRPAG